MDLGQWFWGCLTLFFIVIFSHEGVKQIKNIIVHYYFRGKAHFDTERDFDNREQLKRIERLLEDFSNNLRFKLSDSNKPVKNDLKQLKEMLTILINKQNEEDEENK
ncbi:hypothetical protein AB832_07020 [Flavobacteriaceae bacterium (ex Bugula neritina AB1)]|nr:hypothetical protein AB832_07020 [Flavobacteriaceae bacterium (ex Bugula neritina AB1)]